MGSRDPLFDLAGRVAAVTGASSGLGARFARVLRARRAEVVVAGRRTERLEALAAELDANHALVVPADVTDEAAVRRVVDSAVDRFGRLDIMVNNAGNSDGGAAEAQDLASFRHILEVNLTATFTGCREAARIMLPQGSGSIVNVASIAGIVSLSQRHPMAGYVASKSGVVGLTRELGAQWASRGVRVNAIAPGWFPSELTGQLRDAEQVRWIEQHTPLGRAGRADELDGLLVFLASDASSYVVGQTVVADGGWTVW
jgi:NAD(P)-dependent dehydrogenase (short-subunit alcohol dehydrogenase family)